MLKTVRVGIGLVLVVFVFSTPVLAELRTWLSADGKYKTDAEFVALKDASTVTIRLKDGALRDVALAQLSAADQAFARQQAEAANGPKLSTSALVELAESTAKASKSAKEALLAYQVFVSDPLIGSDTRDAVTKRIERWQYLAGRDSRRWGKRWVSPAEADQARVEAAELIQNGLTLLKGGNNEAAGDKFQLALNKDPESPQTPFCMAMIFGLLVHDFDKAREMYEEALNRDPGNVAILNNLAITEVILRRHSNAIAHFRLAAARSDARQIAKNIERYFNISTDDVPLDSQNRRKLTDLLASVGKSSESDSVSRKVGWQYMLIGALQVPDIDVPGAAPGALITPALTKAEPASAKPQFGMQDVAPVIEEQVVGIIVSPETILVPVNLIVDGATYVVRLSPDRTTTIAATFFAKSEPKGLALLSCPGIESAPLVLSGEAMKSGQECIGVNCSVGAKAGQRETIRGKILAPASDKFLGYCLTTVMLPEGNAGAPIFDLQGRVIGLHNRSYRFTSKLGTAIASRDAIGFLNESMPELQNAKVGDDRKLNSSPEPTKVEFGELCNGPVVLVSALVPPQNVGLSERVGKEFWHDRSCPVCNGTKVVDCTVRTCNRGSITVMETVRVKDPVAGLVEETVPKQYRCTTCNATGTLPCKKCNQTGLDPNLR